MWLKMTEVSPGFNPLGDNTHMHPHLNDASAAFMYTLLSGRCPVVEEPATPGSTAWMQWLGHKIGYETAWQMSHLTTRAPGFRVLPSSTTATTVTTTTKQTMTVEFAYPPQSDVTVNVSSSNPGAAIVSPKTLTFTPTNYNTPQQVTVRAFPARRHRRRSMWFSPPARMMRSTTALAIPGATPPCGTNSAIDLIAGFDGNNISSSGLNTAAGSNKILSNPHRGTEASPWG